MVNLISIWRLHLLFQKTDITDHALEALSRSKVRRVYLVGRRGPLQAAFTVAELRELIKLPKCKPMLNHSDFAAFEKHIEGWKYEMSWQDKFRQKLILRTKFTMNCITALILRQWGKWVNVYSRCDWVFCINIVSFLWHGVVYIFFCIV